jgi:menaquinone-specific isochorismate synthase
MLEFSEQNINIYPKISEVSVQQFTDLIDFYLNNQEDFYYLSTPSSDFEVLSIGTLFLLNNYLFNDKQSYNILLSKITSGKSKTDLFNIPLIFGYQKFPPLSNEDLWNDFLTLEWIIPEIIYTKTNNNIFSINLSDNDLSQNSFDFSINHKLYQESNSVKIKLIESDSYEDWEAKLKAATEKIRENKLCKIVLSRRTVFEVDGDIMWSEIANKLNNDFPECFNFIIKKGGSIFFGSSPELLCKFNKQEFNSEALAGSIERGKSLPEDLKLSSSLLANEKNLIEHKIVIDYIKSNLFNKVSDFTAAEKPIVKKLKNIQHLKTEISGKIKPGTNYFEIVNSIFPTPAVCGFPTNVAISELSKIEQFERGLFAGMIGFIKPNDVAEFYVSIRCGLFKQRSLTLFAGCGIVEDSKAPDEYKETELKFNAIKELFDVKN